jgi:hypothetical protein
MKQDIEYAALVMELASLVDYDKSTGVMVWKAKSEQTKDSARWNSRYSGKFCGTIDDKGYRRITFKRPPKTIRIRAHQLAWVLVTGEMPKGEIDHINQNKQDNRFSNLRDVPKHINQRNVAKKSNNTSGAVGVIWHKQRGKWCAQAVTNGKHHHLGLFASFDDAKRASDIFRSRNGFSQLHGASI